MTTNWQTGDIDFPEQHADADGADTLFGSQVGPGDFSRYVTQAVEGQLERERLHEGVDWWQPEYGPVTAEELAKAEGERRGIERAHAEREERARKAVNPPGAAV